MLGGHTSAVRSALVYARDGLGRPLRMLEKTADGGADGQVFARCYKEW